MDVSSEEDEDKISTEEVLSARKEPQLRRVDVAMPQRFKHVWAGLRKVKPISPQREIRHTAGRKTLVCENSIGYPDIIILQFLILLIHLWRLVVACLYFITHGFNQYIVLLFVNISYSLSLFCQSINCSIEKLAPPFNDLNKELKQTTTWSLPFSGALSGLVFTSSFHWLFGVSFYLLIGRCDFSGVFSNS